MKYLHLIAYKEILDLQSPLYIFIENIHFFERISLELCEFNQLKNT